jgi:hypothetical protein
MNRGKTRNGDAQLFAGGQWRSWQGAQDFLLSGKACIACLVAFGDQILQKLFVGGSVRKIPAPPDSQCLVNGLFEPIMGLFHIPVFMRHPSIVPGGLHPVVLHEGLVAKGPIFPLFFAQLPHSCTQVVGAVLLWNPTQLPERFLDPLSQGLEGFAKADARCFCIGGRQHKVIDHVWEGLPCNGDAQILHLGEIRLCSLARLVSLLKDDLLLRSMHSAPSCKMPLQGSDLSRSRATGMLLDIRNANKGDPCNAGSRSSWEMTQSQSSSNGLLRVAQVWGRLR